MSKTSEVRTAIRDVLSRAIVGQEHVLDGLLLSRIAGGHVLLEGVPGTAKTLMARAFSASMESRFGRIQFTPDLLPSDIIGTNVYRPDSGQFSFRQGPIFTDILLADEINRAPAKTQAALLEAMEERQVTADGKQMPLGDDFLVVATQNPIEYEGTYPLPEAQLDRFLMKLDVSLLSPTAEAELLRRVDGGFDPRHLDRVHVEAVVDGVTLAAVRAEVAAVQVSDAVVGYITAITESTRTSPDLALGASTRGSIALLKGSKIVAAWCERDYVIPEDVKDLCIPMLRHRMIRRPEAEIQGVSDIAAVERAVNRVPIPR